MTDLYHGMNAAQRESAYQDFIRRNLKRNYSGHFLHGMLGMTGFRLINTPTFVPAYLHLLSGSDIAVGLGLALQQLGAMVSPILGAAHIEHRKQVLSVSLLLGGLMRLQVLGLALSGWFLHGRALLIAAIGFLFLLGLFTGPQSIAFQYLLAKMIPINQRGRLQGWRNMAGGLVAAAVSYLAGKYLVGHNVFGNGYGTTFLLAFVLTSLGLTAFRILVREPVPPTVRPKSSFVARLREFPTMLRDNPGFLYFMMARGFAIASRVAAPFYIVYASQTLTLTGATIGALSLAYLLADTIANLAWGHLSDHSGFRSTFIIALVLWIAATFTLMRAHGLPMFCVGFFGLGAAVSGYQMSAQNIVFEFGHRDDMAMRLALSNTAEGMMAALAPLAGGLLAAHEGYQAVFWAAILCELVALILVLALVEEPRKRRLALEAEKAAAPGEGVSSESLL